MPEYSFQMFPEDKRFEMLSLPECISWMTVGLVESVAIVTLNLCTIIVFVKNPDLCMRSTYLLITLAVIDMLAGGVVVYGLFYSIGAYCNVWNSHAYNILEIFSQFFPISSLTNITFIALERMHATFRPFMHRVLKKSVYGIIIAVVWVTAGLVATAHILRRHFGEFFNVYLYLRISLAVMCLLIIFISYVSIVIKVRYEGQPQHHGAASRESDHDIVDCDSCISSVIPAISYIIFSRFYQSIPNIAITVLFGEFSFI